MALNGSGLFNVDSTGQPVVSSTLISASVFNAFTADVATALSNAMYKDGQQTVTANIPMGGYKFTGLAAGANAGESVRYEQLAGSISQTFSAASIDLGHASDTTLSRVSAGVVAVEGVNILTTATGAALAGSASQTFSVASATAAAHALRADQVQLQSVTAFTTGGTSTEYTLTPVPALASLATGHRFRIKFHLTAGATPTLAISGLTAKPLKMFNSVGGKVAASASTIIGGMLSDVEYDGTDYVVIDQLPAAAVTSKIVQVVTNSFGTVASGSTVLPYDDTIPQNTEGDQYLTASITPSSASNLLSIRVETVAAHTAVGAIGAALFQDTTAGALAASTYYVTSINVPGQIQFTHRMTSGTTSATTFKLRVGSDSVGTTTVNGASGARKYGGAMVTRITITEETP